MDPSIEPIEDREAETRAAEAASAAAPAKAEKAAPAKPRRKPSPAPQPVPGGGWMSIAFLVIVAAGPLLLGYSLKVEAYTSNAGESEPNPFTAPDATAAPAAATSKDPSEVDYEEYLDRSVKEPKPGEGKGFFGIPTN